MRTLPQTVELPASEDIRDDDRATGALALEARAERVLLTADGHILVYGWVADEGSGASRFQLHRGASGQAGASTVVLRHSRPDVQAARGSHRHDFGYLLLAELGADDRGAPIRLGVSANERKSDIEIVPEHVSEQRLLEDLLAFLGFFETHSGREASLQDFLVRGGRAAIAELNLRLQQRAARVQHVERLGAKRAGPSFQTVLFGDVAAAMFQPLLFAKAGVQYGEWIYACNSPELADELIRRARTAANLYDHPITVVLLTGNAGFGGANNVAMQCAASRQVVLVNPDVHPMAPWGPLLNEAMRPERFGASLRGGLLFYDDEMLMHGGMYLDEDVHVAADGAGHPGAEPARACRLLRVEHYDKGVPFRPEEWHRRRRVPAVTGAVMAFDRGRFEAIGGFSSDFVYGHYEDADLCLRWGDRMGPVEVDPDIRLVHLEGQGSKTRLPHFHGAAIVNRHVFDARNRHFAEADRAAGPAAAQDL